MNNITETYVIFAPVPRNDELRSRICAGMH